MRIILALKAFWNTLKNSKEASLKTKQKDRIDHSHLQLLGILQQSGRLIDFLKEDITNFSDAQVGAAVRNIHEQCRKSIEDIVTIRPVISEPEGSQIAIPEGYDPSEIRIVGKIKGKPPLNGILRHKGWKAHKISLPKKASTIKREIIFPAEVEII